MRNTFQQARSQKAGSAPAFLEPADAAMRSTHVLAREPVAAFTASSQRSNSVGKFIYSWKHKWSASLSSEATRDTQILPKRLVLFSATAILRAVLFSA